MIGFVIAVLMCSGANCQLVQAEPDVSYPTFEACSAALKSKAAALNEFAHQSRPTETPSTIVCVNQAQSIIDVEEPIEVLDTAIAHAEPTATSPPVGLVEKGQRTLATGRVAGTQWFRVLLSDGKTGYVFGDRLRIIGGTAPAESNAPRTSAPPTQAAKPAPSPAPISPTQPPGSGQAQVPRPSPGGLALQSAPSPTPPKAPPPTGSRQASGVFRDCENCPVMVALPGGSFTMGSAADPSEKPSHMVRVGAFAIGKFEVTRAEWDACAAAGACQYKPAQPVAAPDQTSVSNLSWDDAVQYVEWLAKLTGKPYRLPTEAEWEYAARSGTTSRYSWGDQMLPGKASCEGCGGPRDPLHPPAHASHPPNPWGLYDMEGGVAEWVDDCWHASYHGAPPDGAAWRNPSCSKHVLRGGSWNNTPADVTVTSRNFYDANVRYLANGLRVALSMR